MCVAVQSIETFLEGDVFVFLVRLLYNLRCSLKLDPSRLKNRYNGFWFWDNIINHHLLGTIKTKYMIVMRIFTSFFFYQCCKYLYEGNALNFRSTSQNLKWNLQYLLRIKVRILHILALEWKRTEIRMSSRINLNKNVNLQRDIFDKPK